MQPQYRLASHGCVRRPLVPSRVRLLGARGKEHGPICRVCRTMVSGRLARARSGLGACSTLHRAKGVIWAAAGYQIIARSACVLAPRQSYGSTGIKSLVVTPTLKAASAGRHLPLQGGSDSARNLILRAPET